MPSVYQTKSKEVILACFVGLRDEMLSAKELFGVLRQNGTPVSMATIYRQLDDLVEERMLQRVVAAEKKGVRYRYRDAGDHSDDFLLRCDCCGEMTSADCQLLASITTHLSREHGFQIDTANSVLRGRCQRCR